MNEEKSTENNFQLSAKVLFIQFNVKPQHLNTNLNNNFWKKTPNEYNSVKENEKEKEKGDRNVGYGRNLINLIAVLMLATRQIIEIFMMISISDGKRKRENGWLGKSGRQHCNGPIQLSNS